MEVDSVIYDAWLWTTHNWGQKSLYLMYQKCSATVDIEIRKHWNIINFFFALVFYLISQLDAEHWDFLMAGLGLGLLCD